MISFKKIFGKALGWIVGLVFLAVVYGVINVVFVGGQKLWHHADQKKLDSIKIELDFKRGALEQAEAKLQGLVAEMHRVDAESEIYRVNIDQVERSYPKGIPSEIYGSYKLSVSRYNELSGEHNSALRTYNMLYENYSGQLEVYNQAVNEANSISKKIGSTWYVVPFPGSRHAHHSSGE